MAWTTSNSPLLSIDLIRTMLLTNAALQPMMNMEYLIYNSHIHSHLPFARRRNWNVSVFSSAKMKKKISISMNF